MECKPSDKMKAMLDTFVGQAWEDLVKALHAAAVVDFSGLNFLSFPCAALL